MAWSLLEETYVVNTVMAFLFRMQGMSAKEVIWGDDERSQYKTKSAVYRRVCDARLTFDLMAEVAAGNTEETYASTDADTKLQI